MPPLGLAAIVTGFTPVAVPLSAVFAQALPGCTGHTTPDFVELALPAAGVVPTRIDVPANPALVGFQCHQYVLVFELDALGQLVAITSTNALSLTVGTFQG